MRSPVLALTLAIGLVPMSGGPAARQAPPPQPPPAVPAHPNLSGTWALDSTIGDDPAQAAFEPPAAENRRGAGGRGGRFGFGPGGFRGSLGGRGGEGSADALTADERARLEALTDEIRASSARLTISHDNPSFAVTDAQGRTALFRPMGARTSISLAASIVPSTSSWEGSRLVAGYQLGGTHRLVCSYTLLEKTEQLVVRIHLASGDNCRVMGPEAKFVYSLVPDR